MTSRIAIVSSMTGLRDAADHRAVAMHTRSNGCASSTGKARLLSASTIAMLLIAVLLTIGASVAEAQTPETQPAAPASHRVRAVGLFLAGGAAGLAAHESGHLFFDLLFDADPGIEKVDFHGIPFFAITHQSGLPPRQEFTISSAGFWVQHAGSEWLLTTRPRLRDEHAPFAK